MESEQQNRPPGNRFFGWMRDIGVVRQQGWLGGVCAGIGARLGIDPILVRGITVVAAVLGLPILLAYAAAWLLLPDADDRIHAEELGRGIFNPVIIAIGAMALLTLLPVGPGVWALGSAYWGDYDGFGLGASIGRFVWTAIVVAAIVAFIVWIARREGRQGGRDARSAPGEGPGLSEPGPAPAAGAAHASHEQNAASHGQAFPQAPGQAGFAFAGQHDPSATPAAAAAAAAAGASAPSAAPTAPTGPAFVPHPAAAGQAPGTPRRPAPPQPAKGAPADEWNAWRSQRTEWANEQSAWRAAQAQQTAQERAWRAAQASERAATAAANRRAWHARRRAERPRLRGALTWLTIGAAIVAGGIAAMASAAAGGEFNVVTANQMGLSAALIVVGIAIVAAGIARRRAAFLSIIAIVLSFMVLGAAVADPSRTVLPVAASVTASGDSSYQQPLGGLTVFVEPDAEPGVIDIGQGAGHVQLWVQDGASARVEVRTIGTVSEVEMVQDTDSDGQDTSYLMTTKSADRGAQENIVTRDIGDKPELTIRVWQGTGSITINDLNVSAPEGAQDKDGKK